MTIYLLQQMKIKKDQIKNVGLVKATICPDLQKKLESVESFEDFMTKAIEKAKTLKYSR